MGRMNEARTQYISVTGFRVASVVVFVVFLVAVSRQIWRSSLEARVDGIVKVHVDEYQSGTGSSADLVRANQMVGGFNYKDAAKKDWEIALSWKLIGHKGESDVYLFKWGPASPKGGSVSDSKTVLYDGKQSSVVFQDEYKVISIEPGSIPLPELQGI